MALPLLSAMSKAKHLIGDKAYDVDGDVTLAEYSLPDEASFCTAPVIHFPPPEILP
jgi:uncharacterized Fe-S cluster-containing radical SAM superfamily enzyme